MLETQEIRKGILDMAKKSQVNLKAKKQDSLLKTLDRAAEIVNGWPDWKQGALGSLHLPSYPASNSLRKHRGKKST